MPADCVALDIARWRHPCLEVGAVVCGEDRRERVCFLVGYEEAALRARRHVDEQAEYVACADGPEVLRQLLARWADERWVGFDLERDLPALGTTGLPDVITLLDVGDLAALALPTVTERGLAAFLVAAGLGETSPPRGLPTADAIADLWQALPAVIATLPYPVRAGVGELLEQGGNPLAAAWRAGIGAPTDGESDSLSAWLRARCAERTPAAEEEVELPDCHPIDPAEVVAAFAPDGPLAAAMPEYEARPGQVEMATAVAKALGHGECLLVEAGTGTGKSIAYLVPALRFALANGVRVVVSTNTKNLQDQLCAKDLPLLAKALGWSFRAELVKGRANYLCVEKLLREYQDAGLLPVDDQLFHLAYLLSWAAATEQGDLDELSGYLTARWPRLESYARRLASDGETCTATTARGHPCYATAARRRAWKADLLVVNHALALANSAVEVLPPFRHIVFDEAHNLEDIATEQFGLCLERRGLLALLREVYGGDPRTFGSRARRALNDLPGEFAQPVIDALVATERAAADLRDGLEAFGEALAGLVMKHLRLSVDQLGEPSRLRLLPAVYDDPVGERLKSAGAELAGAMAEVGKGLTRVANELTALRTQMPEVDPLATAAQAARNEWTEQLRALGLLLELSEARYVYWLEFVVRREQWEWRLRAAPIEAGESLAEQIYDRMDGVVLTSATLTVDGSFDYFRHRLGLDLPHTAPRARTLQVPSPFDYPAQVLLGMPTNIAAPQEPNFTSHVARAIEDIVRLLDGRTLVLFTSRSQMLATFEQVAPRCQAVGIEPLCQSVSGTRHVLAERFRRDERAVLFGTRSFWEGIDIPGDALQCVIIVRLPFEVPDDPVFEARCEHLEAAGRNAWSEYSVPLAVIRFKQGFGRLIRSVNDRGVVVCLDRRLHDKPYGRAFLRSVPGYSPVFDRWAEVKERIGEWIHRPISRAAHR